PRRIDNPGWTVARFGHLDLRSEAGFASALKSDTPPQVPGRGPGANHRFVDRPVGHLGGVTSSFATRDADPSSIHAATPGRGPTAASGPASATTASTSGSSFGSARGGCKSMALLPFQLRHATPPFLGYTAQDAGWAPVRGTAGRGRKRARP